MIKLSDDVKRILTSMAYEAEPSNATSPPALKMVKNPVSARIALISDGRGYGAPLDYAIETCLRLGAKIDLLIHTAADKADIAVLEGRIRSAGLRCRTIQLDSKPVDEIFNHINNQPSIVSIVAMPDDEAARLIIEKMIPRRGGSMPIPLILIQDGASTCPAKQSVA